MIRHPDEHQLLQRTAIGDRRAFAVLYDHYHQGIYCFIRKYLKSGELSEDICQNVFIKIWDQREGLENMLEFGAFAFTIAKRQCIDFLKRASVEEKAIGLLLHAYTIQSSSIEDEQLEKEYMAFIEETLLRLPEQTRRIFKLCRQKYKSYDEVAESLGISRNAVKKHMVRSMKVLKKAAESELGISLTVLLTVFISKQ